MNTEAGTESGAGAPMSATGMPLWLSGLRRVIGFLPAGRYRLMQALLRHPRGPFWARMPESLGGAYYWCDLRDDKQRDLCLTGKHEPAEAALVTALLSSGDTFVDVGANWGYFSLMAMSLIGSGGRMVAVEADPRMAEVLTHNVRKNAFNNARVVRKAIADKTCTSLMRGYDDQGSNFGVSSLDPSALPVDGCFEVETSALDTLLQSCGIGRVDLLKMDIEGAEVLAFEGMREGLASHRYARMLVELHPWAFDRFGASLQSLLDIPASFGYRGWWLRDNGDIQRRMLYGEEFALETLLTPTNSVPLPDGRAHVLWMSPDTVLPQWLSSCGSSV